MNSPFVVIVIYDSVLHVLSRFLATVPGIRFGIPFSDK